MRKPSTVASLMLALLLIALTSLATPQLTQAATYPTHISAASQHTCALTSAGGVKCWGYNNYGQLGDNSTTTRISPVYVDGLSSGVTAISASIYNTCALTDAGGVKCWGLGDYGRLGNGSTSNSSTPVNVTGLTSGVVAISTGSNHSCALTSGGAVKCWGYGVDGQLGDGNSTNSSTPVTVSGLTSGVIAISAGSNHTCAVLSVSGATSVKCWGVNGDGQLGDGSNNNSATPVTVSGLSGIDTVSAGHAHSCALTTGGAVKCWGLNDWGALGDGSWNASNTPVNVSSLSNVTAIAAGGYHTCALTTAGAVKCWGKNGAGQLGDNNPSYGSNTPVSTNNLASGVVDLEAGQYFTCALKSSGRGYCWGQNNLYQGGDGTFTDRAIPTEIIGYAGGSAYSAPSWWNGDSCDATHYNNSVQRQGGVAVELTSWRGIQACGPRPISISSTYDGVSVAFPNGLISQYEWQCAELSKRYLKVAYGLNAISGDGKDVATTYYNTYSTTLTLDHEVATII